MGRLRNPILFSQQFGVDPKGLSKLGLFNPILNADTPLFIDPILLSSSKNSEIKTAGLPQFEDHFGKTIRVLQHSNSPGDVAWRSADKLLNLEERAELCLGYGGSSTRGRDLATKTKQKILATAKEIIDLGVKDPELFSLVGLLEEGVGPDSIGDMTANAILPALVKISGSFLQLQMCTAEQMILILVRKPIVEEGRSISNSLLDTQAEYSSKLNCRLELLSTATLLSLKYMRMRPGALNLFSSSLMSEGWVKNLSG
jgi:hypothetical protein